MPESWEQDSGLIERYQSLVKVIQTDRVWWDKWRERIELKDNGIDFKELHFVLELSDLPEKKNWYDLEDTYWENFTNTVPSIRELWSLSYFLESAWEGTKGELHSFLGLEVDNYWSSTESSQNTAWYQSFTTNTHDDYNKYSSAHIRRIKRYGKA